MNVRDLSREEICKAIQNNIMWQQKWSRKLERILYANEQAPPLFVKYGYEVIHDHQEKIDLLTCELERRARVQVFKTLVQQIETYATGVQ